MNELAGPELPAALIAERRALVNDLFRLWARLSDYRFGQLLGSIATTPVRSVANVTEDSLGTGVEAALVQTSDRPWPTGLYWDTEPPGCGSFLNGRPRDPARIPELLSAFARAWIAHPDPSPGQLLEFTVDRARIPENEFGTRWLIVEDL